MQTLDSPRRKTYRATFRAVHSVTTENWFYFVFPESSEAQDAYAYFLVPQAIGATRDDETLICTDETDKLS